MVIQVHSVDGASHAHCFATNLFSIAQNSVEHSRRVFIQVNRTDCATIFTQHPAADLTALNIRQRDGLCCTNRPEIELPLTPDGFSLWPRYAVCQEL